MKNQNEEMITVNVDWRGSDCIGYDVWVAKCSTISRRVRLFLKTKYGDFSDGEYRFPRWYLNGALRRATESLGYGAWFIEATGNYQF